MRQLERLGLEKSSLSSAVSSGVRVHFLAIGRYCCGDLMYGDGCRGENGERYVYSRDPLLLDSGSSSPSTISDKGTKLGGHGMERSYLHPLCQCPRIPRPRWEDR